MIPKTAMDMKPIEICSLIIILSNHHRETFRTDSVIWDPQLMPKAKACLLKKMRCHRSSTIGTALNSMNTGICKAACSKATRGLTFLTFLECRRIPSSFITTWFILHVMKYCTEWAWYCLKYQRYRISVRIRFKDERNDLKYRKFNESELSWMMLIFKMNN